MALFGVFCSAERNSRPTSQKKTPRAKPASLGVNVRLLLVGRRKWFQSPFSHSLSLSTSHIPFIAINTQAIRPQGGADSTPKLGLNVATGRPFITCLPILHTRSLQSPSDSVVQSSPLSQAVGHRQTLCFGPRSGSLSITTPGEYPSGRVQNSIHGKSTVKRKRESTIFPQDPQGTWR
jgi:hypothetical protein